MMGTVSIVPKVTIRKFGVVCGQGGMQDNGQDNEPHVHVTSKGKESSTEEYDLAGRFGSTSFARKRVAKRDR